ncbi:MAG: N-acyl-D-amino-acid deacylase family protein [Aggregatilineales bacterium]
MTDYDLIVRGGTVYDGSGADPFIADVGVRGDTIAAIGDLSSATAAVEVDASGLAVAPGFINMLSWSNESLIYDGRSQSEIRQGVTLEVLGEGVSMGPLNEAMKSTELGAYMEQDDIVYPVEWTTLGEYLDWLAARGVSPNIASFVGSATVRIHEIGYDDREATPEELERMVELVRQAMREGAMGLSSALIYPPATYHRPDELEALARAAGEYGGLYISHIASEGADIEGAVDDLVDLVDWTGVRAEIYHLKVAGQPNWHKLDSVIEVIEEARRAGLHITANMYTYPYSGTGLDACIPPWAHEGGFRKLLERIADPQTRERIKADMERPADHWENMYADNSPESIVLAGFRKEHLRPLQSRTLADVARERGTSPKDTLLDLIAEDESRVFAMYFSMSEDNLRRQVTLPWVSFCSDAASMAPEGVFLNKNPHPRAYGAFARLLAKYVRDEGLITLQEAVRRLTALPAENLRLERRGLLKDGYYADVVVFDPAAIQDHATPENPHQYATGVVHVLVNGVPVLKDGEHTGATPGRVVRGPGWGQTAPYAFDYPQALHPFLTLGGDYSGNYTEFEIGRAHIPDLIRMATDQRLYELKRKLAYHWAPVHAWRRLGQLRAKEAAEPLTALFSYIDPLVVQEMPTVYTMFGPETIGVLAAVLSDERVSPIARSVALGCLRDMAEEYPQVYDLCVGIMTAQLEQGGANGPWLNSLLVITLVQIEAESAVTSIIRAYNEFEIWEDIAGTLHNNLVKLDVVMSDELRALLGRDGEEDAETVVRRLPTLQRSADTKKKAKRKQAKQQRKAQQRRK